jgi:hypothetical protein
VNGDKPVNGLDLTELRKAFGALAADANYRADLDFTRLEWALLDLNQ